MADLVDPDPADPGRADGLREPSTDGGATFGCPVADPAARGQEGQPRQELDRVRQPRDQPVLRPLLHGVRQLRRGRSRVHEHVVGRRAHLEHARRAGGNPKGLGGQPVVQPNGTVIVPFESLKGTIGAFRSTDGGATWSKEVTGLEDQLPPQLRRPAHEPAADRRDRRRRQRLRRVGGLPLRAEVQRQRHRLQHVTRRRRTGARSAGSRSTRSAAGLTTSSPAWPSIRPPSGAGAHLALTYYFYPNAACTPATCQLDVGFVSSPDGGAHWSAPTQLAGPMSLADIAATSQGPMVGDYISTSFNAAGTRRHGLRDRQPAHGQRVRRGHVGARDAAAGGDRRPGDAGGDQRRRRDRPGRRRRPGCRQKRLTASPSAPARIWQSASRAAILGAMLIETRIEHATATLANSEAATGSDLERTNLRRLMEESSGSPDVAVAILDGPVALDHPDLADVRIRPVGQGGPALHASG